MAILQVNFPAPPTADVDGFATTVTGWNVYLNGDPDPIEQNVPSSWPHRGFEVPDGGAYYVQVAAINAQGVGPKSDRSNTVSLTTPGFDVPVKPGVPSLSLIRMMGGSGGNSAGSQLLAEGEPFTVTASQMDVSTFGTKETALPMTFDDFEGLTLGKINGQTPKLGTGGNWIGLPDDEGASVPFREPRIMTYTEAQALDPTISARTPQSSRVVSQLFGSAGNIPGFTSRVGNNSYYTWANGSDRLYGSVWRWAVRGGPWSSSNGKQMQHFGTGPTFNEARWDLSSTPGNGQTHFYGNAPAVFSRPGVWTFNDTYNLLWDDVATGGAWIRHEFYMSNPAGIDGCVYAAESIYPNSLRKGYLLQTIDAPIFRHSDQFGQNTGAASFGGSKPMFYTRNQPNPELDNWYLYSFTDEYIADTSIARIELGDAPTWDACTLREYQVATDWTETSITFTLKQGLHDALAGKYVYVVRELADSFPEVVNADAGFPLAA